MEGAELLVADSLASAAAVARRVPSAAVAEGEVGEGARTPLDDQQMDEGPVICSTASPRALLPLLLPLLLLLLRVRPLSFSCRFSAPSAAWETCLCASSLRRPLERERPLLLLRDTFLELRSATGDESFSRCTIVSAAFVIALDMPESSRSTLLRGEVAGELLAEWELSRWRERDLFLDLDLLEE
jgi:hypothetical protein